MGVFEDVFVSEWIDLVLFGCLSVYMYLYLSLNVFRFFPVSQPIVFMLVGLNYSKVPNQQFSLLRPAAWTHYERGVDSSFADEVGCDAEYTFFFYKNTLYKNK